MSSVENVGNIVNVSSSGSEVNGCRHEEFREMCKYYKNEHCICGTKAVDLPCEHYNSWLKKVLNTAMKDRKVDMVTLKSPRHYIPALGTREIGRVLDRMIRTEEET